jgi:anthranilate synthase component 2
VKLQERRIEIDEIAHLIKYPTPGPGKKKGLLKEVIKKYGPTKSIFGVCLGQQAIGEVWRNAF